ncbi:polymorphic toxin-type HINT domain-containing protein [Promicromonospora aerolata]|uniref:Polymorphic toxin-type HINT domain-containing protein n=1 Tax=Promicromonospora aerolata TaxID=195749 RepID=A0ABW4V5R2_9MICO
MLVVSSARHAWLRLPVAASAAVALVATLLVSAPSATADTDSRASAVEKVDPETGAPVSENEGVWDAVAGWFTDDAPDLEPAPSRGDLPVVQAESWDVEPATADAAGVVDAPTAVHATGAVLDWEPGVDGEISEFQVHRSATPGFEPGPSTMVAPVDRDTTSFTDTSIAPVASTGDGAGEPREVYYEIVTKGQDGTLTSSDEQAATVPTAGLVTTADQTSVDGDAPGVYVPGLPPRLGAGEATTVDVVVANTTDTAWTAADTVVSHEWTLPGQDPDGTGLVTVPLPGDLAPGESVTLPVQVTAPDSIGTNAVAGYRLVWGVKATTSAEGVSARAAEAGVTAVDLVDLLAPVVLELVIDEPTSNLLGAEDFYSYSGKNTGAGSAVLTNLALGNATWNYAPISNPGRGFTAFTSFSYNSMDAADTGMGVGWSAQIAAPQRLGLPLAYDKILAPDEVFLSDGDGTGHAFLWNAETDEYESPPGVNLQLSYKPGSDCHLLGDLLGDPADDAWTLLRPDGTRFIFDCEGYVRQAVDRNGNTQTFHYIERGGLLGIGSKTLLVKVTDPDGREVLTVDYYEAGDAYEYVNGSGDVVTGSRLSDLEIIDHLKSVTDVSGRTVKMVYDHDGLLRRMVDGVGATDGPGESIAKTFRFAYDHDTLLGEARLVGVTDPRGGATEIDYAVPGEPDTGYGERWQVERITDRLDHTTQFDYWWDDREDAADRVGARVTDASGNAAEYVHDLKGRALEVTNALGRTTALTWDPNNNVSRLTEANGAVAAFCYDPKTGYPIWERDPVQNATHGVPAVEDCQPGQDSATAPEGAQVVEYQTWEDGYVADAWRTTSPAGRSYEFGIDAAGNLLSVTDPKGVATATEGDYTTSYTYDSHGQMLTLTDPNGNTTRYRDYTPVGYPVTEEDAAGGIVTTEYDERGQVTRVLAPEDADGDRAETTQTYDAFGRPVSGTTLKDAASGETISTGTIVYDPNDNIIRSTAPNGAVSTATFDGADQVVAASAPRDEDAGSADGFGPERVTTYTYDPVGNLVTTTEPNGTLTDGDASDYVTRNAYDDIYQLVAVQNALGSRIEYDYDEVGNVIETRDPKTVASADPDDFTTRVEYDLNYRPVATTDAAGTRTTSTYDADGLVASSTDALGHTSYMTYDERGATVETRTPYTGSGEATTYRTTRFEYDQVGNQTRVVTPRGVATSNPDDFAARTAYDVLNRPVRQYQPYDPADDRYNDPDVYTETRYDGAGNVVATSLPASEGQEVRPTTRFEYFETGWIKSSRDPHGITTAYDYNDLGQQTARTLTSASGDATRTMTWGYHPDGKQASMADDGVPVGRNVTLVDNSDAPHTTAVGDWQTGSVDGQQGIDHTTHAAVPEPDEPGECDPETQVCEDPVECDPETTECEGESPAEPVEDEPGSFTWQVDVPADGTYDVYVTFPQVADAATDAQYTLIHGDPSAAEGSPGEEITEPAVVIDQTQSAGTWQQAGTVELTKGEATRLELGVSATGVVVADAVKIVRDNSADEDAQQKTFTYSYDANGAMTGIADDSIGAAVPSYEMAYDQLGQIASVTEHPTGGPVTTTYDYDVNGLPVEVSHPDQDSRYSYDLRNLVETVTVTDAVGRNAGQALTTTYAHGTRGMTATQTKGNGNVVSYGYNPDGSLGSLREESSAGTLVASHEYAYDRNGNQVTDAGVKQDADDPGAYLNSTVEYSYDPAERIAAKVKSGHAASSESYVHDANANVVEQVLAGESTTYAYDRNRMESATTVGETTEPGRVSFTYDPFGRQVAARADGEVISRTGYDGFDHVVRSEQLDADGELQATTYAYDPLDRTTSQSAGGVSTDFTYLGLSGTVLTEDVAGQLAKSYQYSPWGSRLSQVTHPGANNGGDGGEAQPVGTVYYGYNARGDVETLTDEQGQAVATYGYTAYGKADASEFTGLDKPGTDQDGDPEFGTSTFNAYRYSGMRWQAGSGSYDMGFRDYSPGLNRFTTRDTYNGALADQSLGSDPYTGNRYAFGGGNPISNVDLDGHEPRAWHEEGVGFSDLNLDTENREHDGAPTVLGKKDGTTPRPADGPSQAEVADAQATLDKSVTDVALDLGWDLIKDFVGYNDLMGCLDSDVMSCLTLAAGITPWGKGLKAIKALYRIVDGAIDFYRQQKAARKVIEAARSSCNSFVPGTLVLLADGTRKPIEDVELGDEVLAADEATGETTDGRAVTALIRGEGDKTLVTITVTGADGGEQSIVATDEHPFWLPDHAEWVDAIDLVAGDWLQTSAGTWTQVTALDVEVRPAVVHNLTVALDHTYYVAAGEDVDPILVHNANCPRPGSRFGVPNGAGVYSIHMGDGSKYVGMSTSSMLERVNKATVSSKHATTRAGYKRTDIVNVTWIELKSLPSGGAGRTIARTVEQTVMDGVKGGGATLINPKDPEIALKYGGVLD